MENNAQLASLDGLESVQQIQRTLVIQNNPRLESIAGLANLTALQASARFCDNPRLPSCRVEQLAAQAAISCASSGGCSCTAACACGGLSSECP